MEYSISFGDLGPEINEFALVSLFQNRFPSCKPAKVMTDPLTGMSRGYGFVLSMTKMTISVHCRRCGVYCGNRPMRISNATFEAEGDTCANYQTICEFWEQPKDLHHMRERQLDIADMNL